MIEINIYIYVKGILNMDGLYFDDHETIGVYEEDDRSDEED